MLVCFFLVLVVVVTTTSLHDNGFRPRTIVRKSELDLFSVPQTQTSMENGNWIECHPLTSVGDDSPIEFEINGNGEDYIDLANTTLYVRAKVVRMNGKNIADDTPVGPVNLFLHSLFSQVAISLNGTQVTTSTNTYPIGL